jgi:hypothetical protein
MILSGLAWWKALEGALARFLPASKLEPELSEDTRHEFILSSLIEPQERPRFSRRRAQDG